MKIRRILDKQPVISIFDGIDREITYYKEHPHDLFYLEQVARLLQDVKIDRVMLLKSILDDFLPGYKRKSFLRSLADVSLENTTQIWSFPDIIYGQRGWISDTCLAQQWGVERSLLRSQIRAGLLEPVASFQYAWYFEKIERFAHRKVVQQVSSVSYP